MSASDHHAAPPDDGHTHDAHGHNEHGHGAHGHEHPSGVLGRFKELFAPHSHDAAVAVDTELETSRQGIWALIISFAVLAGTALLQAVVVLRSGSVALLGDTLHNFADALTAIPLGIAFTSAGGQPPAATPTATAAPRTWPASSLSASSPPPRPWPATRRSSGYCAPKTSTPSAWSPRQRWSALPATSWWPAIASVSAARSARRRWSPTGCTPAPTG